MKRLISIIILTQLTFLTADNYSLSFDGVDDYVQLADKPISGSVDQFTILASFKTNRLNSESQYIYYHGGDYKDIGLSLNDNYHNSENPNSDYTLEFHIAVSQGGQGHAYAPEEMISENSWHMAAIVWSGTHVYIYVDGVLATTIEYNIGGNFNWDEGPNGPFIGQGNSTGEFDGNINEIVFWDDALTAAEITALYNSGTPLDASSNSGNYTSNSGLVAYYKFQQNINSETGSHNGTNSGSSYSQTNIP